MFHKYQTTTVHTQNGSCGVEMRVSRQQGNNAGYNPVILPYSKWSKCVNTIDTHTHNTTCCTTSNIQASPTPSPVSSVSLTKRFISTSGSQIHSSTEPCLSSSVRSTTFEPQVHQPPIFSQFGDSFHPDIGIIYVD